MGRQEGRLEGELGSLAAACLLQGRGGQWPRELRPLLAEALLDASLPRLQQLAELSHPGGRLQLVLWPLSLPEQRALLVAPDGHWRDAPAADPAAAASGTSGAASAVTTCVGAALGAAWRAPPQVALFLPPAAVRAYGVASRRLLQYDAVAEALGRAWLALAGRAAGAVSAKRGAAGALAACRACRAAVAALQGHFAARHAPLWAELLREAREGRSLEGLERAASAHLQAVLASLFLTVPTAAAEAAQVLLDTCEACALFGLRGEDRAGAAAFAAKCQTLLQLLAAAAAALAQQLRPDPSAQGLVADLLALTGQ